MYTRIPPRCLHFFITYHTTLKYYVCLLWHMVHSHVHFNSQLDSLNFANLEFYSLKVYSH